VPRARSSAGEHYVDIVGVAGSIPAAPTIGTCEFAMENMQLETFGYVCARVGRVSGIASQTSRSAAAAIEAKEKKAAGSP
jgi:hypothetical protein